MGLLKKLRHKVKRKTIGIIKKPKKITRKIRRKTKKITHKTLHRANKGIAAVKTIAKHPVKTVAKIATLPVRVIKETTKRSAKTLGIKKNDIKKVAHFGAHVIEKPFKLVDDIRKDAFSFLKNPLVIGGLVLVGIMALK
jgi:hypothetical protein